MMDIFVINSEDFNYDFLIGLDCIKKFKLCQNEKLEIKQRIIPSLKGEEIKNNYDDKEEKNLKEERTDLIKKEIRYEIKGEEKNYTINFNEHIDGKNFEIITDHLEYEEKNEIDKFIEKYGATFAKDKYDIGTVRNYEAHIDLLIEKYPSKRPYRCTSEDRKEIEQQIAKLLETKLIEESYSPFAAPVTLAYKREENKKNKIMYRFSGLK
ncbi:hypothetical protein RF55_17295 [Lasius niger]|uniref:Uncharacterized protein n=1 Tax=Lasius niger TaxID=67767 RepID=A0A0J7K2Z6_LASNI|nr:hypothetical protein RF55_17295 [Lasius niger]